MRKKCLTCNKEFIYFPSEKNHNFCSRKCFYQTQEKNCLECGKKMKVRKGNINRKKYCSRQCLGKNTLLAKNGYMRNTKAWNKGTKGIMKVNKASFKKGDNVGEKNSNWKGGITSENHKIRTSIEFSLWREAVFARDNWTCPKYEIKGGILHAHHIQNFAQYPELRLAIDNGITLSDKAHREFHKLYGIKNNTKEQLLEFLNNE